MIDLNEIFGYDEDAVLAAADPPQPAAPASGDTIFASYVEYSGDMANEDDIPGAAGDSDVALDDINLWPGDNAIDLHPCGSCGGMDFWQSLAGNWRCMNCHPPETAQRLLEKVERLRKRYGTHDQSSQDRPVAEVVTT